MNPDDPTPRYGTEHQTAPRLLDIHDLDLVVPDPWAVGVGVDNEGRVLVAVADRGGRVGVWEAASGRLLTRHLDMEIALDYWAVGVGVDDEGQVLLAAIDRRGQVEVWKAASGLVTRHYLDLDLDHPWPMGVAVGAEGQVLLAAIDRHRRVKVWEAATGRLIARQDPDPPWPMGVGVAVGAEGQVLLAAIDRHGRVGLWLAPSDGGVSLRDRDNRRTGDPFPADVRLHGGRTAKSREDWSAPCASPPTDAAEGYDEPFDYDVPEEEPEAARDVVDVNVSADMPSQVQVGKVVSVTCHVSQAEIDLALGRLHDQGGIAADPSRLITLQLLPKANVEVVDEDRADIPVPAEGETHDVYFDVRPTHAGTCRVWVVVRQGPMPLLRLQLEAPATTVPLARPATLTSARAGMEVGEPLQELEDIPWLSVVEIDRGQDTVYRFDLRSTTLGIMVTFESSPLRNRAQYVANLYHEIENRWLTTAGDTEAFQEELREFGGTLLTQLFPEPLQRILWEHRHRLQHLVVLSSEPFIPWELVHLKAPGQPLPEESWFLAQLGLVRWLYCGDGSYPTQTLHAREDRVRVLCPDYLDPRLKLKKAPGEKQFLIDKLGARTVTPQENEVRAMLRAGGFDILHFAGHGMADSADIANAKILLEGRREHGTYVHTYLSATTVEQQARLTAPNGDKPLVVLNACQVGRAGTQMSSLGGFAHAFLNRGAGAFISSMWSVGDEPASTFVTTLYQELLKEESISEAVVQARAKAREAGDGTWLAYAVYAHPQARLRTKPGPAACGFPHGSRSSRRSTAT